MSQKDAVPARFGLRWKAAGAGLYSACPAPRRALIPERIPLTPTTATRFPRALFPLLAALLVGLGASAAPGTGRDAAVGSNNIGIALLAQFKPTEAEKEFEKALEADPAYVPALVNIGIAQLAQSRYDDAVASLKNVLLAAPDNVYAHYNLSLIYKIQGRAAEGIPHALAAAAADPRDADLMYNLGTLYQASRDLDKAVQSFEAAIQLDANLLPAYYALGRAFIARGDVEGGKRLIQRHQELAAASNIPPSSGGLKYGEQGRYSFAMEDPTIATRDAEPLGAGALVFKDVTTASGVTFAHAGGPAADLRGPLDAAGGVEELIRDRIAPYLGSGAALADLDGDGAEEIVLLNTASGAAGVYRNKGALGFEAAPASAGKIPGGTGMGLAAGDVDNDGDTDLLATRHGGASLLLNDGKGALAPAALPPFPPGFFAAGGSLADLDHDGDLDVFVAGLLAVPNPVSNPLEFPQGFGGDRIHLLRNNGNGSFTDVSAEMKVSGMPRRNVGAVFLDFDNDRDIDFAVSRLGEGLALYSNNRDGTFVEPAETGLPARGNYLGICAGDYNHDGYMDLAATTWEQSLPRIFRNTGSGGFALDVAALSGAPRSGRGPYFGCAFADLDNDGLLDLVVVNGTERGGVLRYLRNLGSQGFEDASAAAGLDAIPARRGRGLAAGDLDADGDLDLLVSNNGGAPTLLRNDGGSRNHWIRVAARGLNSNRLGIGTKVEIKSGLLWQKTEIASGSGYLSSGTLRPVFGLGTLERVDALRLLWPGGVLQDELRLAADTTHAVEELDRKGTSCPILYAWDGREVAFVTDFLGGSAIGYRTGPASFNFPDTDEYVRIPPGRLAARSGLYEIYMNNQLEETIYFDRAALVAVDHPSGTEAHPDERLMPGPPYPPFAVHIVKSVRPPLAARDGTGRDLTASILEEDRVYADGFGLLPFKGYAEEHAIEIDLGPGADRGAVLLLTGWIDYADSTSNLAASQAGVGLVVPRLEALDPASGRWSTILDPAGFPAGLPKTMTLDLTGRLPTGGRWVRITTSMRIYWDRIRIGEPAGTVPVVTRLDPDFATLRYRGFPASVRPGGTGPPTYDYSRDERFVLWKAHLGGYTRYGDVQELLSKTDDRYVVTRGGDEILLGFDAAGLPPPAPGSERTFLVLADGFGKDMDVNSARPDRVGPLPYHAMKSFPYGAGDGYPLDPGTLDYLAEYNTRLVGRSVPPIGP